MSIIRKLIKAAEEAERIRLQEAEDNKALIFTHSKITENGYLHLNVRDHNKEKGLFYVEPIAVSDNFSAWGEYNYFWIKDSLSCFKPERTAFDVDAIDPDYDGRLQFNPDVIRQLSDCLMYNIDLRFRSADNTKNGYPAVFLRAVTIVNNYAEDITLPNIYQRTKGRHNDKVHRSSRK